MRHTHFILRAMALATMAIAGLIGPARASSPSTALLQKKERDPKRAFEVLRRRYDKDLNGKVSESEFGGRPRAWRRLDVDGDGFVTLEDIEARIAKGRDTGRVKGGGEKATPPRGGGDAAGMGAQGAAGEAAAITPEETLFFESRIRPVLANECFTCHSSGGRSKGGLALDSRAGLLSGGATGPALVPGDVDGSMFIEAIRYDDPVFSMPPKTRLSDEEVADLETWVRMGAPWPEEAPPEMVEMSGSGAVASADEVPMRSLNRDIDIEAGREFWSFRPVVRPEPPPAGEDDWSRTDVDRFLFQAMRAAGVEPVADASDRTWLRRVTFDLTGLPPTLEEIAAFEADDSDERDARVVDRLLASGDYAERWGRHWLDVARYAESSGKERNIVYPHAWRYRDWVLDAFEKDLPYNEFLRMQVAGDLMPAADDDERAWNEIATGYLALGSKGHANRDRIRFQLDLVDEQIDAFSQGMLGLTLSCARCHDHKFDPIPTEDYYSMAGIMLSTETHFGTHASGGNRQASDLIELPEGADVPDGPSMAPALQRLVERGAERLSEKIGEQMEMKEEGTLSEAQAAALRRRLRQDQLAVFDDLRSRFDEHGEALPSNRLAMGVSDAEPRDIAVLERGELDRPGEVVARGIPQVFRTESFGLVGQDGSGRAELGEWLSSDDNPLTPRVWANRVWLHMFGTGLVPTPDNFGAAGQAPTHPELLDWLASELVASGWSTKALIREIALSRAYRLDSTGDRGNEKLDPDAVWLWRMPERRMESEALRDAMLAAAGKLSDERPVGSPLGAFEGLLRDDSTLAVLMREQNVRSVYLPSPRGHVVGTLEAFDAPDSEFVTGDRDETTVATQALFLMNDDEVLRLADAFADRLLALKGDETSRVKAAFGLAYGREPTRAETRIVRAFLRDYRGSVDRVMREEKEREVSGANDRASRRARQRAKRQQERRKARERRAREAMGGSPAAFEDPERAAWSAFAQSLFQSAEFRVIG